MLHYASVDGKKGWKINACDPGLTRTNLGGEVTSTIMISGAARNLEDAVRGVRKLVVLEVDCVTEKSSSKEIIHPW